MKCCGICPDGCVLQAKEQQRRPAPKPKPKPKVQGNFQATAVRTLGGDVVRRVARVEWEVSCPCLFGGELPFQVVPSWDVALEIATLHRKEIHP